MVTCTAIRFSICEEIRADGKTTNWSLCIATKRNGRSRIHFTKTYIIWTITEWDIRNYLCIGYPTRAFVWRLAVDRRASFPSYPDNFPNMLQNKEPPLQPGLTYSFLCGTKTANNTENKLIHNDQFNIEFPSTVYFFIDDLVASFWHHGNSHRGWYGKSS
jgi:hypothetical protein